MHRARVARALGFESLPSPRSGLGTCCGLHRWFSVMRSKIKIRTSSCNKAQLALLHDEVRIWIFDDAAEQETSQRPEFRSGQLDSSWNCNIYQQDRTLGMRRSARKFLIFRILTGFSSQYR